MGTPSIMLRRVDNFWKKISLTGCKWSSFNALGTETPVSHSLLGTWIFFVMSSFLSGVIRNWTPQYKDQEGEKIMEQNKLNRLQMVRFECPKYRQTSLCLNHCCQTVGWIPFLISSPSLWGHPREEKTYTHLGVIHFQRHKEATTSAWVKTWALDALNWVGPLDNYIKMRRTSAARWAFQPPAGRVGRCGSRSFSSLAAKASEVRCERLLVVADGDGRRDGGVEAVARALLEQLGNQDWDLLNIINENGYLYCPS